MKKRILFFSLIIAFIFLLVYTIYLLFFREQISNQQTPPFPTPTPLLINRPPAKSGFQVALFSPSKNELNDLSIVAPITFIFNEEVVHSSIEYTITPPIEVFTTLDTTSHLVTFKPQTYWKPGTNYTLTIITAKNLQGLPILSGVRISFTIALPPVDDYPEEAQL